MYSISNFPYFEVQFNKNGDVHNSEETQELLKEFLKQHTVTDLFVISHGWNNDMNEARERYQDFFRQMRKVIDNDKIARVGTRRFAILAVLWPSKKFAEPNSIAGGPATLDFPIVNRIEQQLEVLQELYAEPNAAHVFDELRDLILRLENNPMAEREFADKVRSILTTEEVNDEDASEEFFRRDDGELMNILSIPIPTSSVFDEENVEGIPILRAFSLNASYGPASFVNLRGFVAAENLLNYTTYYVMKQRAGVVGQKGLNSVLRRIRSQNAGLKLHLIGHSFGGRLVTAAAMGPEELQPSEQPLKVETLSLLQAAFSHYGFAPEVMSGRSGFFRRVIEDGGVSGPVLITHTKNDGPVRFCYTVASLLVQDNAAGLESEIVKLLGLDQFFGIGYSGAQKTPEAINGLFLESVDSHELQPGKLHNLQADAVIKNHGDICKPEVAYAILKAVATT